METTRNTVDDSSSACLDASERSVRSLLNAIEDHYNGYTASKEDEKAARAEEGTSVEARNNERRVGHDPLGIAKAQCVDHGEETSPMSSPFMEEKAAQISAVPENSLPADSVPGAFRVRGVDASRHNNDGDDSFHIDIPADLEDQESTSPSGTNKATHRGSLVQADVVSLDDLEQEVMARVASKSVHASKVVVEQNKKPINWRCQLPFILIVVVIVAVVTGVLVSRGQKSTQLVDAPTLTPSAAPTPVASEQPTSFLNELYSIVQVKDAPFPEEGSAGYRALHWLNDQMPNLNLTEKMLAQRYAIGALTFGSDAVDKFEPDVLAAVGWLSERSVCEWLGIICNEDQIVKKIELMNFREIVGTLPSELTLLSATLEVLRFDSTRIFGTIPTEYGMLTQLRVFSFFDNSLSGELPLELMNLSHLEELNLSKNQLHGTLPPLFSNLGALLKLHLADNAFSGQTPSELGACTSLQVFDVHNNRLNGFPSELGQLTAIKGFDMALNPLGTMLASEIGLLTGLEQLNLSGCNLNGTIPEEICDLQGLNRLMLDRNSFVGTIPTEMASLSNLQFLDLNFNFLTGAVPDIFGNLTELATLNIGDNELTGSIPPGLCSSNVTEILVADCMEVECPCCTVCCEDVVVCSLEQIGLYN